MVTKLLKRLAGRGAYTSGDEETLSGGSWSAEREEDRSGPVGYPLPSAWVKMHVWRRDLGRCVLCRGQESVWFDYIVPPWEGGSVSEQNTRLMCERCSRRNKGVRTRKKKSRA
jgi:hypothetical protein